MTRKLLWAAAAAAPFLFVIVDVSAAELRADQKAAVEKLLADIDPATRDYLRPQMEASVAMLSEAQVAALVAGMDDGGAAAEEPAEEEEAEETASPQDLAYNRAQFEPVYRKHWQAQKSFDEFVDARMAAKCVGREDYAVFGSAYRYEIAIPQPSWPRASDNVDASIAILGDAYAPKDGRYDFDFSKVKVSFDKPAVEAAISQACSAWVAEASAFHKKARPLADANNFDGAAAAARTGAARLEPVAKVLEATLNAQAPGADYAFFTAMQNGRRVK